MPERAQASSPAGVLFDPTDLTSSLDSAPKEMRLQLAEGFRLLLGLKTESISRALSEIVREFTTATDVESLSRVIDAPRDEAARIAAALAMLVVGANATSLNKFFAELVSAEM